MVEIGGRKMIPKNEPVKWLSSARALGGISALCFSAGLAAISYTYFHPATPADNFHTVSVQHIFSLEDKIYSLGRQTGRLYRANQKLREDVDFVNSLQDLVATIPPYLSAISNSSSRQELKKYEQVKKDAESQKLGINFTFIIAFPMGLGLAFMSAMFYNIYRKSIKEQNLPSP